MNNQEQTQAKTFEELPVEIQAKLQDLKDEVKEIAVDKEGCFYKYRSKSEIGKKIYDDFIQYNKPKRAKDKEKYQFIFSDDLARPGILPSLQAFQVVNMLVQNLEITMTEDVKGTISVLLKDIFESIEKRGYNASPYLDDSDIFEDSPYIDTLTWAMSSMLSAARLKLDNDSGIDFDDGQFEKIVNIFKKGLEIINDESYIEDKESKGLKHGWNYTDNKRCKHPSLYFTFAVSEMFNDYFSTFSHVIRVAEADDLLNKIDEAFEGTKDKKGFYSEFPDKKDSLEKEKENKKRQVLYEYEKDIKFFIGDFHADSGDFSLDECYKSTNKGAEKELEVFLKFNCDKRPYEEGSPYKEIEDKLMAVSKELDHNFFLGLTSQFYNYNLSATIKEEDIEKGMSTDALFNTLFIINIFLNSGRDEWKEQTINYFTLSDSEKYNKAIENYDDFRDGIQSAYDFVYQVYKKLEKKGVEYKVNEYTLSFDGEENVVELRKAHIRVFTLLPIFVKTKTAIGDFMIQYPQYDMFLYLEMILTNRYKDNGSYRWIWSKDGYSSSDNYYFLNALSSFYSYYKEYEENYSKNANANEEAKKNIRDEYLSELRKPDGKIGLLDEKIKNLETKIAEKDNELQQQIAENKNALKQKDEQIAKLNAELKENPLQELLNKLITQLITDNIATILKQNMSVILSETLNKLSESLKSPDVGGSGGGEENGEIENAVQNLGLALISQYVYDADKEAYKDAPTADLIDKYNSTNGKIKSDFANIVKEYVWQVIKGKSFFLKMCELKSGIEEAINEYLNKKNNNKKDNNYTDE